MTPPTKQRPQSKSPYLFEIRSVGPEEPRQGIEDLSEDELQGQRWGLRVWGWVTEEASDESQDSVDKGHKGHH